MSISQNVAKNTIFQILGRTVVIATTVISTALLTRMLGPGGYGNYVFILSLILFFVTLSDWGTNLIFVREASKSEENQNKYFGNAVAFRIIWSMLCLLVFIVCANTISVVKTVGWPAMVASPVLVLLSLKTSFQVIFQTKLRFEFVAVFDILISLLFLGALIVLRFIFNYNVDLSLVFTLNTIANLVGVVFSYIVAKRLSNFKLTFDPPLLRKILRDALPTGALLLVFSIYNRIDVIILQAFAGPEPVGIYGLAYKIYDNLVLGAAYLASSLFPIISLLISKGDYAKLRVIYKKSFHLLLVAGTMTILVIYPLASIIVKIIGGEDFVLSALPLKLLLFANLFAYFNHLAGYTLIALGKQKISLTIAIVALSFNIILNILFIPRFSYLAAALITILTEALVFITTAWYLNKSYNLRPSILFIRTLVDTLKNKGKIY